MPPNDLGTRGVQSTRIWARPENIEYRLPGYKTRTVTRDQYEKDLESFMNDIYEIWPFVRQCGLGGAVRKQAEDLLVAKITADDFCKHVSKLCDDVINRSVPKKLGDSGPTTVDCMIGHTWFENTLCDTGGGLNLMSLATANLLKFPNILRRQVMLRLSDGSHKVTEGVLENVPLRVKGRFFHVDFHVVRFEDSFTCPLILGRPFLRTSGAIIDCKANIVSFMEAPLEPPPGFGREIPKREIFHTIAREGLSSVNAIGLGNGVNNVVDLTGESDNEEFEVEEATDPEDDPEEDLEEDSAMVEDAESSNRHPLE